MIQWIIENVNACYLWTAGIAATTGALYSNKMFDPVIKHEIDTSANWKRKAALYLQLPTRYWFTFVVFSAASIWLGMLKDKAESDQRNIRESQHRGDIKEITGNMAKMYAEGLKENIKNSDEIKRQIRDSISKGEPQISIALGNDYYNPKSSNSSICLALVNTGTGLARKVIFHYTPIFKTYYNANHPFDVFQDGELTLFKNGHEEIASGKRLGVIWNFKTTLPLIRYDTFYLQCRISYVSVNNKPYFQNKTLVYVPSANILTGYNGGDINIDKYIKTFKPKKK